MSGTETGGCYATSGTGIRFYYAISGTDLAYCGTRAPGEASRVVGRASYGGGIILRACYAMSGTDIAYDGAAYALAMRCPECGLGAARCELPDQSGPLSPYAPPTPCPVLICRTPYTMSGTDIFYPPTVYAMPGTDLVYRAATACDHYYSGI
eukprot:2532307-Rhodomonas_salina.1